MKILAIVVTDKETGTAFCLTLVPQMEKLEIFYREQ
jgi:hypothetical protein